MQRQWAVAVMLILSLVAVGAVSASAADAKSFMLAGQKDSPQATGTAVVDGNRFTVTAKGLKPGAVYTVWFVNMGPTMTMAGAGTAPYAFTADTSGNAKYTATLGESPVGKWQTIFIVRHPTGDPKDMDHKEDALMAKLM